MHQYTDPKKYITRSPGLNLIKVRWRWMQRQMINNSTFTGEYDIGNPIIEWTRNYNNKKHGKAITNILKEVTIDVSTSPLTEPSYDINQY